MCSAPPRHVKTSAVGKVRGACVRLCDVEPINSSWTVHCNFPAGDVIRPVGLPTAWPAAKTKEQNMTEALFYCAFNEERGTGDYRC